MATAVPRRPSVHDEDPILTAAQRAPLVELTLEERALLDEMKSLTTRWIPHAQFASGLHHDDRAP